ncbi:unnamed protein product [Tetraodon nigroviridis]|nr:unnamed protein product [Tetraodon nigroviridis]
MASEVVCGLVFRLLLPVCLAAVQMSARPSLLLLRRGRQDGGSVRRKAGTGRTRRNHLCERDQRMGRSLRDERSQPCLFRYNALSFVYLIYLLLIPLFPEPTSTTMHGHTGRLLQSLCFTSMSFLLLHIIYQITVSSLLAGNTIASDFNCSTWEKSFRQIGFESVMGADAGNGIRVFVPDIGMFLTGLAIWLLCRRLVQKRPSEDMAHHNADFDAQEQVGNEEEDVEEEEEEEEEDAKESRKTKILRLVAQVASKVKEIIGNLITTAGQVVVTILLGLTGIMLPSLTSAVYFFIFLFLCTWWSLCRTFDTLLFSCMCVLMAIFSAGHIIVLYLYQFQFFQESISPEDSLIRVFGFSPIVQINCSSTWKLTVHSDRKWYHFVNPILLLILYYTLATLIRLWLQEPVDQLTDEKDEKDEDLCEEEDLVRNTANKKRQLWWESRRDTDEKNVRQHPKCSLLKSLLSTLDGISTTEAVPTLNGTSFDFVTTENGPVSLDLYSTPQYKRDQRRGCTEKSESGGEVVEEEEEEEEGEEEESEEGEDGLAKGVGTMVKIFHFIMKQSYICALMAMMAWSITYVSWLTFVFLIWSCMLWMVRDRRRYAMLSSPFMVAYGNLLIVLQYIWSFENMKPVSGLFVEKKNPFHSLSSKVWKQQ